jgi:hypothetical protein
LPFSGAASVGVDIGIGGWYFAAKVRGTVLGAGRASVLAPGFTAGFWPNLGTALVPGFAVGLLPAFTTAFDTGFSEAALATGLAGDLAGGFAAVFAAALAGGLAGGFGAGLSAPHVEVAKARSTVQQNADRIIIESMSTQHVNCGDHKTLRR